jgi:hypothetical protein
VLQSSLPCLRRFSAVRIDLECIEGP